MYRSTLGEEYSLQSIALFRERDEYAALVIRIRNSLRDPVSFEEVDSKDDACRGHVQETRQFALRNPIVVAKYAQTTPLSVGDALPREQLF